MRSRRRDKRRDRPGRPSRSAQQGGAETPRLSKSETPEGASEKPDSIGLERIIFFSDAVFAIAITLLVIDIRLPDNAGADLAGALRDLAPDVEGFVISFLVIALYWMAHHRMFRYIRAYDGRLIWLNTLLLMSIAFLPFPTSVISSYGSQSLAVTVYALNLVVVGVFFLLLWIHAAYRAHLIDPTTPAALVRQTTRSLAIVPLVFLVSIPLALVRPGDAKYSWLLIPVLLHFFADRRPAD